MELKCIFTQANKSVELTFRAMERSLRACGCDLPIVVIPFDETRFKLPRNAIWLDESGDFKQLKSVARHPCHRRYWVLTQSQFQYSDTDVVFLRDPRDVLSTMNGFIATCNQWKFPQYAITDQSLKLFRCRSSTWELSVFNSGQFACEHALYDAHELLELLLDSTYRGTLLSPDTPWDQPGFNLLVHLKNCRVSNLTLPPYSMASTWAGDYGDAYDQQWISGESKPYLIHWAGACLDEERPINSLFFQYLTKDELHSWKMQLCDRQAKRAEAFRRTLTRLGRLAHDVKQFVRESVPRLAIAWDRRRLDL